MIATRAAALLVGVALSRVAAFAPRPAQRHGRALRASLMEDAVKKVPEVLLGEPIAAVGAKALEDLSAPGRKDEAYRFSKLPDVFQGSFELADGSVGDGVADALAAFHEESCEGRRVVTVNGVFSEALSDLSGVADGVAVTNLAGADASVKDDVVAMLSDISELHTEKQLCQGTAPLMALSQVTATDATVISVAEGVQDERPLHVLNVVAGDGVLSSPRLVVRAAKDASCSILEHHATVGDEKGASVVNAVAKMHLAEGSEVRHVFLQEMSDADALVNSLNVTTGDGATYNATFFAVGGAAARTNVQVDLNGNGGSADCKGIQLVNDGQAQEMYSSIVHNGQDCESRQQQRNVVAKGGEGVFRGRVHIGPVASGTDSDQLCKTLLLEDGAKITAMPTLEVINDDVAAAHGATVADLDEESIFYLRSRGLSPIEAREVLLSGFVEEFMEVIEEGAAVERIRAKIKAMTPKDGRQQKSFFQSV